jgi:hypothetical protein
MRRYGMDRRRYRAGIAVGAGIALAAVAAAPAEAATTWAVLSTPNRGAIANELYGSVKAFGAADAWSVGWYYDASFHGEALLLHWNGTAWSQMTAPDPGTAGNTLEGVAGTAANQVWAVGYTSAGSQPQPLVLRWNGTAFSSENVPQQQFGGMLSGVATTGGPAVFAAGTRTDFSSDLGAFTDHTLSIRGSGG